VLQCVAVCCSVLQCVAVCCSVLQCAAVCCSVLQCVAVCGSVLQCRVTSRQTNLFYLRSDRSSSGEKGSGYSLPHWEARKEQAP